MILTLTPNPGVDKTIFLDSFGVGESVRSERYTCIAGGKGVNVARAVHTLGREVRAIVLVGGHTGAHVVEMMEADGIDTVPCWVTSPTRTITTVLEEPLNRQTVLFEPGSSVTETEAKQLRQVFVNHVKEAKVVTFNGVVSDPILDSLYAELIPLAKASGAITILDSHGPAFAHGLRAAPYMIKPNIKEAQEALARSIEGRDAQWEAVKQFHSMGIELVVLSLGRDGALVSHKQERFHVSPPPIKEINPIGSGDALVAGIAIGLMEAKSLRDALTLGIAAAAANATSWDIGHFTKKQVEELTKKVSVASP